MTYPSDEAVMRAIQSGHLEMLGVLFERYRERAFALCYGMTRDRELADDLVQEAFLRVLRYRDSFRARSRFSTWFYRVVRNVCLDHLEASNRETEAVRGLAAEHQPPTGREPPDDDRLRLLRTALDRLSPDKREVIVLKRFHGLRYSQIAARCGANEGAMRTKAHRALQELKTIVRSLQGEEK